MEQDGGGIPIAHLEPSSTVRDRGHRDWITLAQPRPGMTRRQNDYIETPLRPQLPSSKCAKGRLKDDDYHQVRPLNDTVSPRTTCLPGVHRTAGLLLHDASLPITAQPAVVVFKKEKQFTADAVSELSDCTDDQHQESIICRHCLRCKCEACRTPRHLPSRWICNNKCLCSAQAVVDCCSCVCCVQGLFYHWAKDYEMDNMDTSCADQPCSCSPHQRLLRWACLGLLALPLPCLCCYWPFRGCVKACEACYTRCTAHGCRCSTTTQRHINNSRTGQQRRPAPEKRLLDTSSDC